MKTERSLYRHAMRVCTGMLALMALVASANAQDRASAAARNLAQDKGVQFAPAPNYPLSTDERDEFQLTDGKLAKKAHKMWTQKPATVGWQRLGLVTITLDLEQVEPISGVGVHSAAGLAGGVEWPARIQILVSDDGTTYHDIGNLLDSSPPPARTAPFQVHWFKTNSLKTHGRYVKLLIEPGGTYFFTDEIQIYRGHDSWLRLPLPDPATDDVDNYHQQLRVNVGARRRINQDIQSIGSKIVSSSLDQPGKLELLEELDTLRKAMKQNPASITPSHDNTILPLNPLHEQVLAIWGQFMADSGTTPLTARPANLWDYMDWISQPGNPSEGDAAAEVWAMRHEVRSTAVNLTNATDRQMEVELTVQGLDARAGLQEVHAVAWTDTAQGEPVATALLPLTPENEHYTVTIPAGTTRQVWLTFQPTAAGQFAGQLVAHAEGHTSHTSLQVNVLDLEYPTDQHLHVGGWDYTNRLKENEVTPSNRDALVTLLQAYGVDTPWGTRIALPWGKYDGDGNMTQQPDMSNFDQWIELWPNASRYAVYVSVGSRLADISVKTEAFANAARQWAQFIAQHAASKGVQPEQLLLHLVDEPRTPERYQLATSWAEAIRSAESGLTLWINPTPHDLETLPSTFLDSYDVFCFHRIRFMGDWMQNLEFARRLGEAGKGLELYYTKGPMTQQDPYGYVRLQAWLAWEMGANASSFWSFTDNGAISDWKGYAPRPLNKSHSPIFMDNESATPSKQLAALRAGVQDYEYLWLLRDAIQRSATHMEPDLLDQGRALMDSAVERVLASAGIDESYDLDGMNDMVWSYPKDRGEADQVRIEIGRWLQAVHAGAEQ